MERQSTDFFFPLKTTFLTFLSPTSNVVLSRSCNSIVNQHLGFVLHSNAAKNLYFSFISSPYNLCSQNLTEFFFNTAKINIIEEHILKTVFDFFF